MHIANTFQPDNDNYRIVVVTRHSKPVLYQHASRLMRELGWPMYTVTGSTAEGYIKVCLEMDQLLGKPVEIVVNLDDDAFLLDAARLRQFVDKIDREGYDYSGIPDGGLAGQPRTHNPCSMNPFFNVFFVQRIRQKTGPEEIAFHDGLRDRLDLTQLDSQSIVFDGVEAYYATFFNLLQHCRAHIITTIRKLSDSDHSSTVVCDGDGHPLLVHTWYAREYGYSERETKRINNVIALANSFQPSP